MKRTILLVLALAFLVAFGAQGLGIVVGVKGGAAGDSYFGPDYWTYNSDNGLTNSWKLGFASGVFCTVDLGPWFSLQPEVLLVQAGSASTEEASYWGPYEGKVRHVDVLTYLSIPLLAKFRLGILAISLGADARFRLGSGVARLRAKDPTLQQTFEDLGLAAMRYPEDRFAPMVAAAVLGLEFGLPFRFLRGEWSVESRAEYSFANILGENQGAIYNALEISLLANYGLRVLGVKTYRKPRGKVR
jgi:hypothetical protein